MKSKKTHIIRLNANENFYGCSDKVLQAIKKDLKNVPLYPSMPIRLEGKLAEKFGVKPQNIVVGAGSVRLIDGIIQTFVEPDEEVIIFERSFIAYEQLAAAHRRKYVFAKQTDFICDPGNIFPCIKNNTKVIFLSNPNNPTGTIITHDQLKQLLKNIPEKILVVIDEAYCEYATDKSFPDSFELQKKHSNLIILRTFSKIYGLAGLRIGYGIMKEEMADKLRLSRIPFFFNSLSEDAALAALSDEKFVSACAKKNSREREFLCEKLKTKGYHAIPSEGNFIYVHFNSDEEKEAIYKKLADNNFLISNLKVFGQDKSLRIGIGDRKTNTGMIKCL